MSGHARPTRSRRATHRPSSRLVRREGQLRPALQLRHGIDRSGTVSKPDCSQSAGGE